jgi:hypothetical protein
MYRAALGAANPTMRDECDSTAQAFGETWVIPRVITTLDDDWLTPAEAADFLCVSTARIRGLRIAGRLKGRQVGGEWRYQVVDLRRLQTETRRRTPRVVAEA